MFLMYLYLVIKTCMFLTNKVLIWLKVYISFISTKIHVLESLVFHLKYQSSDQNLEISHVTWRRMVFKEIYTLLVLETLIYTFINYKKIVCKVYMKRLVNEVLLRILSTIRNKTNHVAQLCCFRIHVSLSICCFRKLHCCQLITILN